MLTFATPDLVSSSADAAKVAHAIAQSITSDLRSSGRFMPVDSSSVAARDAAASLSQVMPRFEIWRAAGVQVLVTGRVELANELNVEFLVWDVATGQFTLGRAYVARPDEWLQMSHAVSSAIFERYVGEKRDF